MTYETLTNLHLYTVLPAFAIGTYLLFSRKGTQLHRFLGKVYVGLMASTALATLLMSARVGPALWGHFGAIHLLSVLALVTLYRGVRAARRGDVVRHRGNMLGLYAGGLLLAGGFALMPGRLLHTWLWGAAP